MAAWQFDLSFTQLPYGTTLPASLRDVATTALSKDGFACWTMLDGWTVYGDEVGNRIDYVVDDSDPGFELQARLDARSNSTDAFIGSVCALAALLACQLHSDELGETLEPSKATIADALQRSTAWQFALGTPPFVRLD